MTTSADFALVEYNKRGTERIVKIEST